MSTDQRPVNDVPSPWFDEMVNALIIAGFPTTVNESKSGIYRSATVSLNGDDAGPLALIYSDRAVELHVTIWEFVRTQWEAIRIIDRFVNGDITP